jgi:hypothetical protein
MIQVVLNVSFAEMRTERHLLLLLLYLRMLQLMLLLLMHPANSSQRCDAKRGRVLRRWW